MITEKDLMSGWVYCSYNPKHNRKDSLMSYEDNNQTKYQDVITMEREYKMGRSKHKVVGGLDGK